jgi:2-keto-4-pentenoate hydratase/2-oxohepta-3-ene-1,7-dioic acid hydratase in catechol pathway
MQFVTFLNNGGPEPGVLSGDSIIGLKPAGFSSLLQIIEQGEAARKKAADYVASAPASARVPLASAKILAPIARPPKLIFIGLNYRDHAEETGASIPDVPTVFAKYSNAVIAHGDTIILPKASKTPDYEAELAIVIGKKGKYITQQNWREYVFGYTNLHDVSARDVQKATTQWVMGKTFDTFAPYGPAIVTADEIPDPNALKIELVLNGEVMQSSNTKEMVFSVPYLLEFLSKVMTLEPGDIISTGTPAGVGMAKTPPRWLLPGDIATVRIQSIPELTNPVAAEA